MEKIDRLIKLLKEKKLKVATAESCTGGGIAKAMTEVAGSSEYFNGGIVAYQNEVKENILGVSHDTIEKYNVVSEEVVLEMARGAMKVLNADCAVATSGIAGPGGGDDERPVGTIWIAAAFGDKTVTLKQEGDGGRTDNREMAISNAIDMLTKVLEDSPTETHDNASKRAILVIPDIHGRNFWKGAVEKYADNVDRIVFLGDYLDRYEDEGITRNEELENFKEIISLKRANPDKVILLYGNHCYHYIDRNFARSSRFSSSNAWKYRELFEKNKDIFQLAYEEIVNGKTFLFTHAGVCRSWYERNKRVIGDLTVDSLNRLAFSSKGVDALSDVSNYRSWLGYDCGSILWSDVRERFDRETGKVSDKEDIDGLDYQIFGHTRMKEPIITDRWACLDCSKAFILTEDGKLETGEDAKNDKG